MAAAWNNPPNWPAPPAGWQPAPGWRPDPSWPAAPAGWQFWTQQPTSSRWLWLKIGGPLLVVVAIIVGVGGTVLSSKIHRTHADARNAAVRYLDSLKSQQFDAAGEQLCESDMPYRAAFVLRWQQQAQAQTSIADYKITYLTTVVVNGHQAGGAVLDVTLANGQTDYTQLPLVETAGHWRPCPIP